MILITDRSNELGMIQSQGNQLFLLRILTLYHLASNSPPCKSNNPCQSSTHRSSSRSNHRYSLTYRSTWKGYPIVTNILEHNADSGVEEYRKAPEEEVNIFSVYIYKSVFNCSWRRWRWGPRLHHRYPVRSGRRYPYRACRSPEGRAWWCLGSGVAVVGAWTPYSRWPHGSVSWLWGSVCTLRNCLVWAWMFSRNMRWLWSFRKAGIGSP